MVKMWIYTAMGILGGALVGLGLFGFAKGLMAFGHWLAVNTTLSQDVRVLLGVMLVVGIMGGFVGWSIAQDK